MLENIPKSLIRAKGLLSYWKRHFQGNSQFADYKIDFVFKSACINYPEIQDKDLLLQYIKANIFHQ